MKKIGLLMGFFLFSFSIFSIKVSEIPEIKWLKNYAQIKDIEVTKVIDLNNVNTASIGAGERAVGIETYNDGRIKTLSFYLGKNRDGSYYEYYPNGDISREVRYNNGKMDGPYFEYSIDGSKSAEAVYKNDLINGTYTEYVNGEVKFRTSYVNGKKDGEEEIYDDRGKLVKKNFYTLDIMRRSTRYYPNLNIVRLERVIDLDGKVDEKGYEKNGVLLYTLEGLLINNRVISDGKAAAYGSNGQKNYEYNYEKGQATGKYLEYNKDGTVRMQTNLKNGNHSGDVFTYYPNGSIEVYCSGVYRRDIVGKCYSYDKNGKVKRSKEYNRNYPGLSTSWGIREVRLLDLR